MGARSAHWQAARRPIAIAAVDWRWLARVCLIVVNDPLLGLLAAAFIVADSNADWHLSFAPAGQRVVDGGLYAWTHTDYSATSYVFRYSPVTAWVFRLITPIGALGWAALHFAALIVLPRRIAMLTLVSAPFWADVYDGNITTFAFVAAAAALGGSRLGTVAFFAIAAVAPKPLLLSIVLWLLWQRPETRAWFLGVVMAHAALVFATGWGPEWIASFNRATDDLATRADLSPAMVIGPAWVIIGLPLAAWLAVRGRLGLASLLASPYWLLHYPLLALVPAPVGVGRR